MLDNPRQSVVPYSLQVKLNCGLLRANIESTFIHARLKWIYNNAIHFMIRCEPWIMKNLIGFPGSICSPDRQGGSTCFSREMACCLGVRVWPLDAAVRIAYVMACYSN